MNRTPAESTLAVCCDAPAQHDRAAQLAARLKLPLADGDRHAYPLSLALTADRLELRPADESIGPVFCDFIAGSFGYRRRGSVRDELIGRAVGWKGRPLRVVDATAGLGRDAVLLALLGCNVTAIERHPVIAALLADGVARAQRDVALAEPLRQRLRLIVADARDYLRALSRPAVPEVIYLDPMFPPRSKSAQVKKESRILGQLLGPATDAEPLLAAALATGCRRIVVKRPLTAEPVHSPGGLRPAHAFKGKAIRFDLYLPS